MLSSELAGRFYTTVFMAQFIVSSIRFSKWIIFTGSELFAYIKQKIQNNKENTVLCIHFLRQVQNSSHFIIGLN